jgi:hypothetical protein
MMVGQQGKAMANPRHLAKLDKGVETWNSWLSQRAGLRPELGWANLRNRDLLGANLASADLSRANLRGADLSYARLSHADLSRADLSRANLTKAYLENTNLNRANLDNADVTGAKMGWTSLADNDLSTVKGLETVRHDLPSTVGIDTVYRSRGNIPESFLRGCGVPDSFLTYMTSLVASAVPIEFYSCFISYSSKDDAFATELHAKLQLQHVRCWKDSEDLKIGDKFQDMIESAIRLHDKLLLVLSENSINSSWVEWEVKKALKKEQEQGSTVLFPVRLDDAVMDTPYSWAAEVRKRHIGDFCKWKDHDSFQKSLDRLLRDLKSQDAKPKG